MLRLRTKIKLQISLTNSGFMPTQYPGAVYTKLKPKIIMHAVQLKTWNVEPWEDSVHLADRLITPHGLISRARCFLGETVPFFASQCRITWRKHMTLDAFSRMNLFPFRHHLLPPRRGYIGLEWYLFSTAQNSVIEIRMVWCRWLISLF